jgi:spore coat polysaccharide biosynthesis protein SpsF
MRIGAIIQARTGSTRLPGKLLKPLPYNSEISVLQQVIRRVKRSAIIDDIIIATTENMNDDIIPDIVREEGVKYFRGSEDDVLSRYYFAAKAFQIDLIVRITSDCPCIDYEIIDDITQLAVSTGADYAGNTIKRTFPRGLDVEAIKLPALEKAYFEAKKDYEREHVSDYIYDNPEKFLLKSYIDKTGENHSDIRITIDTYEDYMLVSAIYDYLYNDKNYFNYLDIIKLFNLKPWLYLINKEVKQKKYKESGSY